MVVKVGMQFMLGTRAGGAEQELSHDLGLEGVPEAAYFHTLSSLDPSHCRGPDSPANAQSLR